MIYLHPSWWIKDTDPAGNIAISESLLDEHLSHIAYFVGDKRPFALRIEASNGVVLDEHSTTATELSVRIYTSEGVDVTEFVTSLNPSWQIGAEAVGQGLSYTVQASSLKSWHTKIVVTTSAARILDAMGKLQGKTAEEQRLLERLTIDASIEVRRDFVLLQRIPTAELIRDTLKLDKEFIAATTGKQGAPGKDAAPIRPNLFEFASLDKNSREQGGLRIDEVTAGKRLSAGTMNIHGGRDLTRVTTGVAVQLDLIIYRTARENGEFKRNLTLRTMRPPNDVIYDVRSKPYPEAPGTYHMELICPISKEQSQDPKELYIHAWLLDWGRGFIDCELRNVKVEYLYEGEPQKCSAYIPNTSDMIPLLPKIENGEWLLPDQLTRKYLSTGVKAKGEDGTPGAKGDPGKSVTPQEVVSALNTASFRGSIRDTLKADATFVAATKGDKGDPGKSVTPQEVADTINTADWQNQIASATASNILKTPTLSNEIRQLVQPDTTEFIKRYSSRTMRHDILSKNGDKYRIIVPAFALFEPEVEDGAAVSLHVSIRQPIGSCTNPNNHDERGYFFIVESWEPIYTTSAEKLCDKRGEIKVYYDSEQCAESLLSIKLERSNGHWVFVNYYDFAASIQAECTQIVPQSHYSKKSQDEMLSYAPLQYLSGVKRNAILPSGRVGLVIKVWANKWVGDVRVYTEVGESLYNTSHSTGENVGREGVLIPAGHIGEFICLNEEKIWLFTDLSR